MFLSTSYFKFATNYASFDLISFLHETDLVVDSLASKLYFLITLRTSQIKMVPAMPCRRKQDTAKNVLNPCAVETVSGLV